MHVVIASHCECHFPEYAFDTFVLFGILNESGAILAER